MRTPTVALIGSFRQHYAQVLEAHATLTSRGITVTTPEGGLVIDPAAPFVRFDTDGAHHTDEYIQCRALHRILRADAVYIVAPQGYVGRTTCYEIGRCMQARRPLYFSEHPVDLPVAVPPAHVITPTRLAEYILEGAVIPMLPHDEELAGYERRLLAGDYDEV